MGLVCVGFAPVPVRIFYNLFKREEGEEGIQFDWALCCISSRAAAAALPIIPSGEVAGSMRRIRLDCSSIMRTWSTLRANSSLVISPASSFRVTIIIMGACISYSVTPSTSNSHHYVISANLVHWYCRALALFIWLTWVGLPGLWHSNCNRCIGNQFVFKPHWAIRPTHFDRRLATGWTSAGEFSIPLWTHWRQYQ